MSEQRSSAPPPAPASPPPASTARPAASPPVVSQEEMKRLIVALDNPADPIYVQAEDELIILGSQAVPALIEALSERGPWLRAFRAAEALGQIGDGRASGPLVAALQHPNSNVRWSAARALAKVGDWRVLQPFSPLRAVARSDRGKTSWGESVASAAQATINDMSRRSTALRMTDPAKTAILSAVALFAILLASSQLQQFRETLASTRADVWGTPVSPVAPTPTPADDGEGEEDETSNPANAAGTPTAVISATATPGPPITATVLRDGANIRSSPDTTNPPLARVPAGEKLVVLEKVGTWYKIRRPGSDSEEAWISADLLGPPSAPVPTR